MHSTTTEKPVTQLGAVVCDSLTIRYPDGTSAIVLNLDAGGAPTIDLNGRDGEARASLTVDPTGNDAPSLSLFNDGECVVWLTMDSTTGRPRLVMVNPETDLEEVVVGINHDGKPEILMGDEKEAHVRIDLHKDGSPRVAVWSGEEDHETSNGVGLTVSRPAGSGPSLDVWHGNKTAASLLADKEGDPALLLLRDDRPALEVSREGVRVHG